LEAKIHLAEWKIFQRLQTISADSDHHEERSAIADALNALRFLKRDTLKYPDWNPR
jgi:CheY-like chemotaxis protein